MTRLMAVVALVTGGGLAVHAAKVQQPGIRRVELQRHDLSTPEREVVQVRVELDTSPAPACANAWLS
jgi:hypothetical protein